MPKGNQGRPRYGEDRDEKYYKLAVSINPSLDNRLERYCADQDRSKSWVIRQVIDKFLKEQGY